jgi:phospholipid/cholesterol/gamma-HCH transport system substrate-binding protein
MAVIDSGFGKTDRFLVSLASAKSGGELLPTVISMRELVESFHKRSIVFLSDGRRMLGDLSQSMNKGQKPAGRPAAR